jgi:hypothetical protein
MSAGVEIIGPFLGLALMGASILTRFGRVSALLGAGLGLALGFIPLNATDTMASTVLAVLGPASASFYTLCVLAALRFAGFAEVRGTALFAGIVIAFAAGLYPSALGFATFDAYAHGFSGVLLPALMVAIVALAVLTQATALAIWFGFTALVIGFRLHPSLNTWDALIDMPSVVIALGVLIASLVARLTPKRS